MGDLVQEMYERARRAFEVIEFWPQDRVDEMVAAVGWELQKDTVAREVVQLAMEAGLGVFEDKVAKQKNKVRGALWDMRGAKTCGVVEVDSLRGITKIAKPIGITMKAGPGRTRSARPINRIVDPMTRTIRRRACLKRLKPGTRPALISPIDEFYQVCLRPALSKTKPTKRTGC